MTLATLCASGWSDAGGNLGDFVSNVAADVVVHQVIDLIQGNEPSHGLHAQVDCRVDDQLLGQFDGGAGGAAHVFAGAALRAQAGDNLDDQVDLIGQQRDRDR